MHNVLTKPVVTPDILLGTQRDAATKTIALPPVPKPVINNNINIVVYDISIIRINPNGTTQRIEATIRASLWLFIKLDKIPNTGEPKIKPIYIILQAKDASALLICGYVAFRKETPHRSANALIGAYIAKIYIDRIQTCLFFTRMDIASFKLISFFLPSSLLLSLTIRYIAQAKITPKKEKEVIKKLKNF